MTNSAAGYEQPSRAFCTWKDSMDLVIGYLTFIH